MQLLLTEMLLLLLLMFTMLMIMIMMMLMMTQMLLLRATVVVAQLHLHIIANTTGVIRPRDICLKMRLIHAIKQKVMCAALSYHDNALASEDHSTRLVQE